MEPRRITYVLGEPDLEAMLLQQSFWRRDRVRAWFERLRGGPVLRHAVANLCLGALVGLLLLPLWSWLTAGLRYPSGAYPAAVVIAALGSTALQRYLRPRQPRLAGFYRWTNRHRSARVLARSTLGDIEVLLEEDGLLRTNAKGVVRVPWSEVVALLHSPSLFTMLLTGSRVLIAPRRAFACDDAAADAFRREVERLSGKRSIPVPDAG